MKNINAFAICLFLFALQLGISDIQAIRPPITLVSEVGHTYLVSSTRKAIETRRLNEMDRLSKDRGTQEEEELAREIALHASDYTAGETHESSIKNFVESNFGMSPRNLYCVAPNRIGKREFVFIDKEIGIVVKIFPQIPKHYFKIIHELSGHVAFEELNIPQMNMANFLALGKYSLNGTEYLLLGMSFAQGKEIKEYFNEIYSSKDLTAKQEAIDQVKRILRKLGQVIGEIHVSAAVKVTPSIEHKHAVMDFYIQAISKAIDKYKNNEGEHSDELIDYFNQVIAQYDLKDVYFSIFHGDAHLANFLFDKESDGITIIDSVKAHLSIDSKGSPISDNHVHDCVKIEEAIAKQIVSYESNDLLIQELVEAFHQGYDEKAAAIINPSSLLLDKSYHSLRKLVSSMKWKHEEDTNKREAQLRSYDYFKKALLLR